MAEAFGVVAGVAGLASLAMQINDSIDTLRSMREQADAAPEQLKHLTSDLQFLARCLQEVIHNAPSNDDFAIEHCQTSCEAVVKGLIKLKTKFANASRGRGPQKLSRIFAFRHWRVDVEELLQSVQGAKLNLIL
jgi:hypothetical protein